MSCLIFSKILNVTFKTKGFEAEDKAKKNYKNFTFTYFNKVYFFFKTFVINDRKLKSFKKNHLF